MILNENLIKNNVLKNTLIEEIVKINSQIAQIPLLYNHISYLSQQISIQDKIYQQQKQKYFLRQERLVREKQVLKEELQSKMFYKMTQQQSLSSQMKHLKQNCFFIRQKKQQLSQLKAKQNRLINQLEELEVHEKQAEEEISKLELKKIYDQRTQNESQQTLKQFFMLIEAKRTQLNKQQKLTSIISEDIEAKENKVKSIKGQINKIQVSKAKISSSLQSLNNETSKIQTQAHQLKVKISSISSTTSQMSTNVQQNTTLLNKNMFKSKSMNQKITQLIQQSNDLNQKIIQTRDYVLKLNSSKNDQKKVNMQLKSKVRQLMKITIQHQAQQTK